MTIIDIYNIFKEHPIVTTDSRDCPAGSMFFALRGDNFNGNAYAGSAIEKGCAYAVIDDIAYMPSEGDERFILVDNVLKTMQQLANMHRRTLGTTIIGITGTNGKTTTKELVAAVLSKKYNILYTQGNLNNHIGVPKTLLKLNESHEIAVIEMGANHPGEIKVLTEIAEPDYGIITNVGKAHLEGFGSFEGVIKTKGELYDFIRVRKGKVFINKDNDILKNIAHDLELIGYGQTGDADLEVMGTLCNGSSFMTFDWWTTSADSAEKKHHVETHLIGAYNIDNALAAATIGKHFGVNEEDISNAISEYIPSNNRSQMKETLHNRLIIDTYNANPTSMKAALDNFRTIESGSKMCILGQMGELGIYSEEEHEKILAILSEDNMQKVWLVGKEFIQLFHTDEGTEKKQLPQHYRLFENVEEVKKEILKAKLQGFTILIKASNSIRLFELPELL